MNKLFILAGACVILASCKQNKPANESADIRYKGDTICVSGHSVVNSKIKRHTVTAQNYSAGFNTTGTVKAIAGHMAEIAPPFDGRISKSFVQLGQKVNAGAPLFELHSSEFFEATKSYFQTLQTKKLKALNLQRRQDLVKNGVGVAKELEEAETDYEVALKDYENATATLRMFNLNPDDISMGQALAVVSPVAGEVVRTDIVIGQYVKSDAPPLAIVAELSKVWVAAQVKEKYIGAIRTDDRVEIRTDANPEQVIAGHVSHISELLDEETRSIQVLITCNNEDRKLKPGMFAGVRFINRPQPAILVPSTALLQAEEDACVFVCTGEGEYVKRMVKTATASLSESLIIEGLQAGEVIVSEGGIYLMAN
jgi:cobalt-zinc-cadmium efflux system membrane fusion protein